jgi:hypothetical protein
MTTTVTAKITIRKGTAAQWTSANPVLLSGEMGYETDTGQQKIGDGVTAWTSLAYYHDPDSVTDHGALTGLSDDDHLAYHTDARGDARYSLLAHNHTGTYEPAGAITTHEAAANPHPGYLTPTEGDAAYSSITHDHAAVYAPIAKGVTNLATLGFAGEYEYAKKQGYSTKAAIAKGTISAATLGIAPMANDALKDKGVQDALTVVGLIPFGGSAADQLKSSQVELERWGPLIKRIGFSVDS